MAHDLALICDGCSKPITDDAGYLWVDNREVSRTEHAFRKWEAEHTDAIDGSLSFTGGAIFDIPEKVRWQVHHATCDPAPDASSYDIPATKIRSWAELLEWTAHLMEKSWLTHTDWQDILRGVHTSDRRLVTVA
ncbi:hypothetical protein ABZX62_34240 [Streptomyces flavidovirens]|uniref:hypothetical protein n=1 Tax=Streptomyces flavidovirens TaxID=67298 RepID=UPI0033BF4F89